MSKNTAFNQTSLAALLVTSCSAQDVPVSSRWRNPGQQCVPVEVTFSVTDYDSQDSPGGTYGPWCGMRQLDGHIYCFDVIPYGSGLSSLVDEGAFLPVPPGHAELPCWAPELAGWRKPGLADPLRARPQD